ncbi:MAG TPA: phosphoribosylglycinamide synthetase C domain-containing protein, partial [Candidatus Avimonas sp.]|nr:phosphoribosylglycinamide synthetase C domain-containing protein [Candidatus Avimonas sp.]
FIDIITAIIDERLDEINIEWSDESCACVVMASGGYPGTYKKGVKIEGLDSNGQVEGATVYHAGTKLSDGVFYTNGGRVLGVTAKAETLDEAIDRAYEAVHRINFESCHYRRDIGRYTK